MAISITHAFVSAVADGADPSVVKPSQWNAALVTAMATARLLGRATAATGVFEEITLGTNLSFTGTTLNAAGGSSTWDTIGAAAGSATTANGTNNIVYNVAVTADTKVAWTFGETSAATNGTSTSGVPNQVLLKLATLAASTQSPLSVYQRGNHVFSVDPTNPQILAGNGAVANPLYSFAAGVGSGWYWNAGTAGPSCARGGSVALSIVSGPSVALPLGSASNPSLTDMSSNSSGLFWISTNVVGIACASNEMVRFTGSSATNAQALFAPCTFANLGTPANGSFAYCSDCDAPTLVDSTCTNIGAKTGSFAARVNGAWKCFS